MRRKITGLRQDDEGHWIADLSCLHSRHVRHEPPMSSRPWVLTEVGRAERVGTELDCAPCDRGELPPDLTLVRTAGPFDETTLPAGLRRAHRVAASTWGRLRVLDGSVSFRFHTDPPVLNHLSARDTVGIPPLVEHEVSLTGAVRLAVDFYARR